MPSRLPLSTMRISRTTGPCAMSPSRHGPIRRASSNVATTMLTAPTFDASTRGATGGSRVRPGQRRSSSSARHAAWTTARRRSTAEDAGPVARGATARASPRHRGLSVHGAQLLRSSPRGHRLRTVLLESLGRAQQPISRNGRQATLLLCRLEAQPATIEAGVEGRSRPRRHPAIDRRPTIAAAQRGRARAPLIDTTIKQSWHDVPRLPLGAPRIPEYSVSHLSPPVKVRAKRTDFIAMSPSTICSRGRSTRFLFSSQYCTPGAV